ncbi:MAG: HAD family hydrolase [Spirochaetota bacterium]
MGISAIGLDVDGTLYPNGAMRRLSVPRVLRRLRLFLAYRRVRDHLRTIGRVGDFYAEQARLLGAELGITPAEAQDRIDRYIYEDLASALEGIRPFPDLADVIIDLKESGLRIGLLSDFPFGSKLDLLGLPNLWDCLICAEEVGALKPHPEPFRALARCLDTPAEQMLYVGNSYENDIVGAKGAGMQAAHLSTRARRESVADVTFADYGALLAWIARNR